MGWDITITPQNGMPEVDEPILGVSSCLGNFYSCIIFMAKKQLQDVSNKKAINLLNDLIKELDKGNDGIFSDKIAVDSDKQWSQGQESRKDWDHYKWLPPYQNHTYETWTGLRFRERVRKDALRFLLYYKAGYKIDYKW